MSDIFISYARDDQATAKRYAEALEAEGLTVWWDAALRSGEAYDEVIEAALTRAKAVVVLWSASSVVSRWVRAEATLADRAKTLVPVMIEPCELPIMFELTQTTRLADWLGDQRQPAWTAFVADLRRFVEARTVAAPALEPAPTSAAKDARPTVLVLPFANMSGDPEQEYFSDGVSEDIITDLGKVGALAVISRNTAFSFKGKTVAAAQLARQLGVSHILEGSVRRSGPRVRITAQLLDAASDSQVWAERFDRTLDDIFAIQDEISEAIVGALKVKLAPAERKAIETRATANPEAYELYLLARQFDRTGSERMKPLIVRICERIVELDPGFARAWAQLSFAEAELSQRNVAGASPKRAVEAAERAIALAPDLAEAHAALAEAIGRGPNMDLPAGEVSIATALRLDPQCYEAHLFAGYFTIVQRQFDQAIIHFEAACALDPLAYRPAGMVVQAYDAVGDRASVESAARRSLERCERILATEPDHSGALGFLVTALAELGQGDRARQWTRWAVLFDPDNLRLRYNLACGLAKLHDTDGACDLLEKVIEQVSGGWLRWIDTDNSLDPIRDHPRFAALMARAKARAALEPSEQAAEPTAPNRED
ncbi:MAG TPA: TIR domain-containing protein [Caulobacteraceae bacterium]